MNNTRSQPEGTELPGIIGSSNAMCQVSHMTRHVAPSLASVLLAGETGTGKELVAKALHLLSDRSSGPFIRVNCGALSESLLESELFGHMKGAFTGAVTNRTGRFEAAHAGTIFLDEICSTSEQLQVKLLRVLQEGEFERVGDTHTLQVDVRVIAATNRDLEEEIAGGRFREDLYFRLNVVQIDLPPLRERAGDIPELVDFFLQIYCAENKRAILSVSDEAMRLLEQYDWPGNVRELQNNVARAVVLCTDATILPTHLSPRVQGKAQNSAIRSRVMDVDQLASQLVRTVLRNCGPEARNLHQAVVGQVERELIEQVMAETAGVQVRAAGKMGINRNTLHKKLKEYGLEADDSNGSNS